MERLMRVGIIAITFVFLLSIHGIEARKLIQTEDITQVNKIRYNDIYDCVDFYKQPAFYHPLLANHTFHPEMRPSSIPRMTRSETNVSEIQFKGKGCPIGTVPIRRITEKDHIKEKYFVTYGSNYTVQDARNPGTHYAVVRTRSNPTKRYNGATACFGVWNPPVQNSQYSSAQLVIRNGNNNIQVGWTVNPTLYRGDKRTRLFIYTGAGSTQCFNTHCPGFVVTNRDVPVDDILEPVSKRGGPSFSYPFMIHKEKRDGHWWLTFGQHLNPIGFWPKNIFTGLADMAINVEWGGQVHSPPDMPSPPMGSGGFLKQDSYYDAFCSLVQIVDEAHDLIDATDIEAISDSSRYQVMYKGNVGQSFGNLVFFGGPGGITGN